MSILGLSYFLVAAEEMNFTSAAKRLYITQQSLSNHIRRLEEDYQVTLFNRKPRLSLTPEGSRMVKYATRIVRLERVMSAEFADMNQAARGVLSLGISRMRARHFFQELWTEYKKQFPNIEIYLTEGSAQTLEKHVISHKVDMSIGVNILPHPLLSILPLMKENIYIVIPEELFRAHYGETAKEAAVRFSRGIGFDEIPDLPFLLLPRGNRIRALVDERFDMQDRVVRPAFESNDLELIMRMSESGAGISFVPATSLFPQREDTVAAEIHGYYAFPVKDLELETVLAYPTDLELPHYALAFVDLCRRVFSERDVWIRMRSAQYLEALRGI